VRARALGPAGGAGQPKPGAAPASAYANRSCGQGRGAGRARGRRGRTLEHDLVGLQARKKALAGEHLDHDHRKAAARARAASGARRPAVRGSRPKATCESRCPVLRMQRREPSYPQPHGSSEAGTVRQKKASQRRARGGAPVDVGRLVHLPALQQLRLRRGRARVSAGLRLRAGAAHRRQLFCRATAGQKRIACTLAGSVPAQTAAADQKGDARAARDA